MNQKEITKFLRFNDYSPETAKSYRWHLVRLLTFLKGESVDIRQMSAELFLRYLKQIYIVVFRWLIIAINSSTLLVEYPLGSPSNGHKR